MNTFWVVYIVAILLFSIIIFNMWDEQTNQAGRDCEVLKLQGYDVYIVQHPVFGYSKNECWISFSGNFIPYDKWLVTKNE